MKKIVSLVVLLIAAGGIYWFLLRYRPVGQPVSKPNINNNEDGLGFLSVPEGWKISLAADGLDGPRVVAFDPKGRILVSETKTGRVRVLEDIDKDGKFEDKNTLIKGLRSPHGLAFLESSA